MATYNTTIKQFIVTASANADFRAIIAIWRAAFTAWGWVQAGDSGQINPSTVNFPGSNNTSAGQEIWYFNDGLQATRPVGIRIHYRRGGDANDWAVSITVSMSVTDGNLVFLGQESGSLTVNAATAGTRTNADTTAYKVAGSGDTNRGVISFFHNVASSPFGLLFSIERTRDADGDANGDGVVARLYKENTFMGSTSSELTLDFFGFYQATWVQTRGRMVNYLAAMTSYQFGTTVRANDDLTSTLNNGKVYAFPFYPTRPGWKYPLMNLMMHAIYDFPIDLSTVVIPFYGSDRTYMPLGPLAGYGPTQASVVFPVLMWYE